MIGETLGSYEVRKRIGEGGMGEVYLAEHKHMGRMAAIKVLRPQFSGEAELVGRFFAEARSTNLVKHPGIVQVYDCAVHTNGRAYIVMEYLEGQTLGAALEQLGCVDEVMTIVDLSWQIATALQAAHNKDIIHRDLKPDNIFLTFQPEQGPSPVVKILDFGIAKLLHSKVKATQTGSMLGTPLYMSPEQGRGAGLVDHRTDIYSLGCIMFELYSGHPPFSGSSVEDVLAAHMTMQPPPLTGITDLSPKLATVVLRLLTKNRRNHHFTPSYASVSRLTLIPPAILPIAPPMKTRRESMASGIAAQTWGSAFWSPQVQRPETEIKAPSRSALRGVGR